MDKLEKVIKGFTCCDAAAVHLGHCQEDCPYFPESERADKCVEKLHSDALSLLKAQEPRVMTLEELSTPPINTPVFIEEINDECGWNVFYGIFYGIDEKKYVCFCGFKASADCYDLEEYDMSWRCWTARPTDEQREATPWE